ncbi:MAG: hypothetical protein ACLQVN_15435 [Bryobacteraceae bacterium]
MNIHVRMHRWVVWWIYVGVVCGVVALVNIFGRDLSRAQERLILLVGVLHWVVGGLVCYACDAIRIDGASEEPGNREPPKPREGREWHPASDFLLPGGKKSLLPPRY